MVIREDGGGRRRSRRASTVDDGKLKKAGTNKRKRIGIRMRSTESPDINTSAEDKLQLVNLLQVEGVGNSSSDPADEDTSLAPAKRVLELILDTLQRRDVYELFAEPVDPTEVEDYYEIIKDPMDFGTMRAKLHEDMYQFLHQFEHDVFLIFRNAMHFNTSASIYFKQARALEEMAKRVFHTLKIDPEKFELEFDTTKRRSARKICSDDKDRDSNLGSCSKHPRDNKRTNGKSTYLASLVVRDGRAEYKPWRTSLLSVEEPEDADLTTMYVGSAPLLQVSQQEIGYTESLMAFVNDLGPTAKRVALRKMKGSQDSNLSDVAFNSCNSKKSQDGGKRTEVAKIINKQIVLAVPAAPRARGHGCPNRTQLTRPLASSAGASKPSTTTTKAAVKGGRFDPKSNDSSTCNPRISVDIVVKEPRKTKTKANKKRGQPAEQVKGGMEAPSWQLNRLDLNVDASLSGPTTTKTMQSMTSNPWHRSGEKVYVAAMGENTINNGAAAGWSHKFDQCEGWQGSDGSSASNINTGRDFYFDISYLRSRLNGASHMISPRVGAVQPHMQMQMQLSAFNSIWPSLPNSKFGA